MSQARAQQHLTVSKVAADYWELMTPQCIMRPATCCPH